MSTRSEQIEKQRRLWGRGFCDGLRAAGVNPEEFMNYAKQQAAEKNLTGIARKVLDCVPIQEAWTSAQIQSELRRNGVTPERRIVEGCLDSLKSYKLVREPIQGQFQRVPARQKMDIKQSELVALTEETKVFMPAQIQTRAPDIAKDPLSRMAELSKALRSIAAEAEDIALEMEARAHQLQNDTAKLRQLQQLLKGLGS